MEVRQRTYGRCARLAFAGLAVAVAGAALGQTDESSTDPASIRLDFPESIELQALVDYASQTLGLNIVYDESIRGKTVFLRSPASVPKASLLGLVRSVLRVKGLALIEDDHPGWLRVVQAQALPSHVREIRREPTTQPTATRVITQIIPVQYAELNKVVGIIKPFLTTPGGSASCPCSACCSRVAPRATRVLASTRSPARSSCATTSSRT